MLFRSDFGYADATLEAEIIAHEAKIDSALAAQLVKIGARARNLKGHGIDEGASTRMLIQAGRLMSKGIQTAVACNVAIVLPISDDPDIREALNEAIAACV